MNTELNWLIGLVKSSNEDVKTVVQTYFDSITWSSLKDEWNVMTESQKTAFINKLTKVRSNG